MSEVTRQELERALTDLGAHLEYPSTPPLAEAVSARLAERPTVPTRPPSLRFRPGRRGVAAGPGWRRLAVGPHWRGLATGPGWRRRLAVAALAILVVAAGTVVATPGAREAVARRLGLRGVEIRLGGPPPSSAPSPTSPAPSTSPAPPPRGGANLGLGRRVSLEQARAAVSFPLRVPTAPGFARPDAVYLSENVPGGRVDLVYRPRPGLPASPSTNVGLLVTQFRGELLIEKMVRQGTRLERVTVGDDAGYWFSGEPHPFVYLDSNRQFVEETARLAGSALIWTDGSVTWRLEGQVSKEQALRIAESMR